MNPDPPSPRIQGAHEIITLLRSTIATRRLPYQHGTEERALGSLVDVFKEARAIMAKHRDAELAARISAMLNEVLRPFTARWHRLSVNGGFNSRDGGDAFRAELSCLQKNLEPFAREFHRMAYDAEWSDQDTPAAICSEELAEILAPLPYGIPEEPGLNGGIPAETAKEINLAERKELDTRRSKAGIATEARLDAIGLAFSGGGIRSGTFCLGVAQVLADKSLVRDVDFLSTVSGGGFTGGFLAKRYGEGAGPADLGGAGGPDPGPIRYLRLRAKYLAAGNLWETFGMVGATLGGMAMNWSVPLALVTLAAILATLGKACGGAAAFWLWGAAVLAAGVLISIPVYFARLRKSPGMSSELPVTTVGMAAVGIAFLLVGLLDLAFGCLLEASGSKPGGLLPLLGKWNSAALAAIPVLTPVVLRFMPVIRSPGMRKVVNMVCLSLAGLLIPLLGVVTFLLLRFVGEVGIGAWTPWSGLVILGVLLGVLVLIAWRVLDINLTAPFRLYRNGLRGTFVSPSDGEAGETALTALNPTGQGPCHLVNCAVNLPSSRNPALGERKSDFFLFSKHWSGSPVVGYRPTGKWVMNGTTPDLASAIATSGAAFSSHMGLGSIPPLRALLTLLNIRLGCWIRQPEDGGTGKPARPGFSCLLREMTGLRMSEKHPWLNLSDGGHIENLATYELLRRRCKFIVCVDGEADPDFTFHGFMTLVRHARIDLGVRIDAKLDDIRPDPATGLSRSHYHLCRIHYPGGGSGLLLYLKLSVTGNESELIKRYRGSHPAFPHQSTLDQFFDEEQFEAYRQLGAHVAEGLFAPCLTGGETDPGTIRDWFTLLAGQLLESPYQAIEPEPDRS